MLDKKKATSILEKALSFSKAEQTEVLLREQDFSLTRFAENVIHQNLSYHDHTVMIRVVQNKRTGIATVNMLDEGSLESAVQSAELMASLQQPDESFVSLPRPLPIPRLSGRFVSATARSSPEYRGERIREVVRLCQKGQAKASGAFQTQSEVVAVGNSLGVRAYFPSTDAQFSVTVKGPAGQSGWAQGVSGDVKKVDINALATRALQKALAGKDPVRLEAGKYTVILEEAAVAHLLLFLGFLGFGAKTLAEGRSFMKDKIGQKIASDQITIVDDALDPRTEGMPFDYEGVPKRRVPLIEQGIARGVVYDSYYANKMKTASTGHALPADNKFGPYPKNLIFSGGKSSYDDLIGSTERGILVTHLWYVNFANPMKTMVTGTTRDGTFLIERGKVTRAVKDMRFSQSILEALSNVEMMTKELKLCPQYGARLLVPTMKVHDFEFVEGEE